MLPYFGVLVQIADLLRELISLFERPRTRLVWKIGNQNHSIVLNVQNRLWNMYLCLVFDVFEISRQIWPVISLSKYMHPLGPIILLVTDFSKSYIHWMEFYIQIITTTWILIVVCWSHSTRRSVIVTVLFNISSSRGSFSNISYSIYNLVHGVRRIWAPR